MRRVAIFLLFAFLPISVAAQAPETFGVGKVSADSLARFLRQDCGLPVYMVADAADQTSFTVRVPRAEENRMRENFASEAFKALKEAGYTISEYDGKLFILKGLGISTDLPAGYFLPDAGKDDGTMIKYAGQQKTETTFQNKIYEIGEKGALRKGKVTVSGTVRNSVTGEPLVGVSVYDENGAYAISDAFGYYKIILPTGDNILKFSGYSLEDQAFTLIVYEEGEFDVTMKDKVFALTGAVITSESQTRHRVSQMGVEKVRINAIKNVPVAFGEADVIKVVMSLPGVKTVGEASGGLNVRGGSTDQNLILFNGTTVYNPNHMFGLLSSFNSDVISDMELYKSSIPVEYGGRISSVLEISSREGNSKKVSGSLGLGLLTSRAHIEGPLGKKTTFNFGVRTTYSDWLLGFLPAESGYSNGTATFQDLNAGVVHRFNNANSLRVNAYLSGDHFRFSNDTSYTYNNAGVSARFRSNFNDRHSAVFSAGYGRYSYDVEDRYNPADSYRLSSGLDQGFAKVTLTSVINEKHTLTYGLSSDFYNLNRGVQVPLGDSSIIVARSLPVERALEDAIYLNETWNVSPKVSFDAGVRLSHFLSLKDGKNYLNPEVRVSGRYSITPTLSWKAGFNTLHQYIHKISNSINISPVDTWKLSEAGLAPQSGWQAATGLYANAFHNTVDLTVEAYYKKVENFIDYRSGAILVMNENLIDELVATQCEAWGVEFLARRNTGKLNGWISYTYSRSRQRETDGRGIFAINGGRWYNSSYDKPHDLKVVANYKFTHRYSLSANLDYSTGRPVTIPIAMFYGSGQYRLVYSDRNEYRIPDYFRLDLAVIIEPGHYLKKLTHMFWTLGVYNVTGRHNPYSIYYTPNKNGHGVQGHMLCVLATQIPYVNFNLKF